MKKAAKKKNFVKWRPLTKEQERMIVMDSERGKKRSRILLEYGITSDQFCHIIHYAGEKRLTPTNTKQHVPVKTYKRND
jgi:hypothetical protein